MQIVRMDRGAGKTTTLIEAILDEPLAIYVAATTQRARFAFEAAVAAAEKRAGKKLTKIPRDSLQRRFISASAWLDGRARGAARSKVYIDDVEDVLEMIFGEVGAVTTSIFPTTTRNTPNTEESR